MQDPYTLFISLLINSFRNGVRKRDAGKKIVQTYLGMRHPIDFIVMSENVCFYDGNRMVLCQIENR